jgi:hypothetical protein
VKIGNQRWLRQDQMGGMRGKYGIAGDELAYLNGVLLVGQVWKCTVAVKKLNDHSIWHNFFVYDSIWSKFGYNCIIR